MKFLEISISCNFHYFLHSTEAVSAIEAILIYMYNIYISSIRWDMVMCTQWNGTLQQNIHSKTNQNKTVHIYFGTQYNDILSLHPHILSNIFITNVITFAIYLPFWIMQGNADVGTWANGSTVFKWSAHTVKMAYTVKQSLHNKSRLLSYLLEILMM